MTLSIAFLGNGEVVHSWSTALRDRGLRDLRAFVRPSSASRARADRPQTETSVRQSTDVAATVGGADVVIAAVPGSATVDVARAAAPVLDAGTLYVDVATCAPEVKEAAAATIQGAGGVYADAAILGTVLQQGLQVPLAVCGPGAERFGGLFAEFGMDIRVVPGAPGSAARLKLLRSVYMKGRDALILEMLEAARAYGIEHEVITSIPGQPGAEPFGALAERVSASTAKHASRRVAELQAASRVVAGAGMSPTMTDAAAQRISAWSGTHSR
jgi:3-hydroxyisobutyrate dehydrogenase-like beta-hydroxyacid dehydrogenase